MRKAYEEDPQNPRLAAQFGPASEMVVMIRLLYAIRNIWETYFQAIDVFVSPVGFVPAFPHDHAKWPPPAADTGSPSQLCRPKSLDLFPYLGWGASHGRSCRPNTRRFPLRSSNHGAFLRGWNHHSFRRRADRAMGWLLTTKRFCVTRFGSDSDPTLRLTSAAVILTKKLFPIGVTADETVGTGGGLR